MQQFIITLSYYCSNKSGHIDVVKFLVETGADPNMKNTDGHTPLDIASYLGNWAANSLQKLYIQSKFFY